jgi:N-acyl homoserine lactone hydrolase
MRLTLIDFGRLEGPEDARMCVSGYVIGTDDGRTILIDAGWHAEDLDSSGFHGGWRVVADESNLLPAQLATVGLTPSDVDAVILTHPDPEHIGGLAYLPDVPVVVSRAEREQGRPVSLFGEVRDWPRADYRLVEPDLVLEPGIELLSTPGHTPGHMSVLLRLANTGPVLLTGDAIHDRHEYDNGGLGGEPWSATSAASAERLMERGRREDALVLYPHDADQWPTLRHAPAYYD